VVKAMRNPSPPTTSSLDVFTPLQDTNSDEEEDAKTGDKDSASAVLQEQLVGIINNILKEQDNFRAR
jgi:hypothetical protein